MVCLGCLMVEDLPQWLLDLHLGPPSPSNLAVLVSGSWSSVKEMECSSTFTVDWIFHMQCSCDRPHALLMGPSTFTVDMTFYVHCWWDFPNILWRGPSTCSVNGTFYMQCWWGILHTMLMRPSTYSVDGVKRFVPCSCKLISDRTAMEQKKKKNSFEVEFFSIIYTLTSKSYKLQSTGITVMNHHAWFNNLFFPLRWVSLCNSGCLRICFVDQADLDLRACSCLPST